MRRTVPRKRTTPPTNEFVNDENLVISTFRRGPEVARLIFLPAEGESYRLFGIDWRIDDRRNRRHCYGYGDPFQTLDDLRAFAHHLRDRLRRIGYIETHQ